MSPKPIDQDVSERPTLTLVEADDGEPMNLTRGDWRGLWHCFDLMHRAQVDLGEQMGGVRSTVHAVKGDLSKVLVSTTEIASKLAAAMPAEPAPAPAPQPEGRPLMVNVTLGTLLACAVLLTGRQMGWW